MMFSPGVDYHLGVNQNLGLALLDPFLCFSSFFFILTEKDVKIQKKMIFTSPRHVKHPFAGWNTQQLIRVRCR